MGHGDHGTGPGAGVEQVAGWGGPGRALLITGANEIATLAGGLRRGVGQDDPAIAPPGAALACLDGRVLVVAPVTEARDALAGALEATGGRAAEISEFDADGGTVTPGLIDSHTHLLFGGSREQEIRLRQRGATYLEVLAAGGGILSTVAATRAASDDALLAHGRRWLAEMSRQGTTTVEAKSGYGLDVATELRLLAVAARLAAEGPVDVLPTWLGAHAVPAEVRAAFSDDAAGRSAAAEAYIASVISDQLPAVAAQGLARFADVFCEAGVFTADQARRVLVAARQAGLELRLHADELAPSGGAELAAELGVCSADHLGVPSPAGIEALIGAAATEAPVVATLLPTVGWFLGLQPTEPARFLLDSGVPVAIATDFNPGTSPVAGLPLAMTAAALTLRMTPSETLVATTVNAAAALRLADRGALVPGARADIVVWDVPTHTQIPYWAGAGLARTVIVGGPTARTTSGGSR